MWWCFNYKRYTVGDPQALLRQYDRMVAARATTEVLWQQMASLMRPTRSEVRVRRSPGQQQTQQLYDGTVIKAISDLASALSGSMSSVDYRWFTLSMGYEPLNQDWETKQWLEDTANRIFTAFQQSNFGSEIHEVYQDLVVFGTACLWMDERPLRQGNFNGFVFKAIAPGRYVIGEDGDGRPSTVASEITLSAWGVVEKYGDDGQVPEKILKMAQDRPDEQVRLIRFMRPINPFEQTPRRRYELLILDPESKTVISTKTFRRLRVLAPRWEKSSEEVYGRGRGHIAYPDVATLNRAVELRLRQWAKAVDPPVFTLEDGVIGKLRLSHGTRTVVRSKDSVTPFIPGAQFDVANFQEEQIRNAIRNYFFADQLQIPNKSYMTAFEVQSYMDQMQRLLAPNTGRLKEELFNPLIDYAFDAMMASNAIAPLPPVVLEAAQAGFTDINVVYTSPLTRNQRANELGALQQVLAGAQTLLAVNPQALDNYDLDVILRDASQNGGVPAKWLKDPRVRDEQRAQQAEQAAQMQQQQMQMAAADTTQKLAGSAAQLSKAEGGEA